MKTIKLTLIIIFTFLIYSCSNSNDSIESNQSNILGIWDLKTIDGETEYYTDGWGNDGVFQFIFNNENFILRLIGSNDEGEIEGTWSINPSETEVTISNDINNNEVYEIILLTETDMVLHKTSSEFVFEKAD